MHAVSRIESPEQRQAAAKSAHQYAQESAVLRNAIAEISLQPKCAGRACALATLKRMVNDRQNALQLIATRQEGGHA